MGSPVCFRSRRRQPLYQCDEHLSVDCDCDSHLEPPEMNDIGIFASLDLVALDLACVDQIYDAPDDAALIERTE